MALPFFVVSVRGVGLSLTKEVRHEGTFVVEVGVGLLLNGIGGSSCSRHRLEPGLLVGQGHCQKVGQGMIPEEVFVGAEECP